MRTASKLAGYTRKFLQSVTLSGCVRATSGTDPLRAAAPESARSRVIPVTETGFQRLTGGVRRDKSYKLPGSTRPAPALEFFRTAPRGGVESRNHDATRWKQAELPEERPSRDVRRPVHGFVRVPARCRSCATRRHQEDYHGLAARRD